MTSVDGAVAVDGRSGGLSSPADKAVFTALRATSDVVLVGAGTARTEDYGPVRLPDSLLERRLRTRRAERPAIAVVTASGRLDPRSRLFEDPHQRVLVLLPAARLGAVGLPTHVEQVAVGDDGVQARRVVAELHARGLGHVLCEDGPRLLATLIGDELVDELCLTLSPTLVGGGPRLLPAVLPSVRQRGSLRWWRTGACCSSGGHCTDRSTHGVLTITTRRAGIGHARPPPPPLGRRGSRVTEPEGCRSTARPEVNGPQLGQRGRRPQGCVPPGRRQLPPPQPTMPRRHPPPSRAPDLSPPALHHRSGEDVRRATLGKIDKRHHALGRRP